MAVIGVVLALVFVTYAGRWVAKSVTQMPHTPAPVRRAAQTTADAIGNPAKAIKKGRVVAAESVDTIWAKARAEDWRERQQARRAAAAAPAAAPAWPVPAAGNRAAGHPWRQRAPGPNGIAAVNGTPGAPGQNGRAPKPATPATAARPTPPPPPATNNGRTAPVTTPTSTTSSNGAGTGGMASARTC